MSLDLFLAAMGSLAASAGACLWMVHAHRHPEHVTRDELSLLRELIQQHHESTLRELEQIRDTLSHPRR